MNGKIIINSLWGVLAAVFMVGQITYAQQNKTGGRCEIGDIPRCSIEYYNDGSRSEVYTDAEGGARVEWRFSGDDMTLTNIFFYPAKGVITELEIAPETMMPTAALTYTSAGKLLAWRTYDVDAREWTEIPLSTNPHKLERFVDPSRRKLRTKSCPRDDLKRCRLVRNNDGSSTERLFFPNGKLWEENIFKTSNRMDFEFSSYDFWGREKMRKIYDRISGNLKTAYWFSEQDNQTMRYIYDVNTGKEIASMVYDTNHRVLRFDETGRDGMISKTVWYNPDGSPKKRSRFKSSVLTEETFFWPGGMPASRLIYNRFREVQAREMYTQEGKLSKFKCISGGCKQRGHKVYPAEPEKSVCQWDANEPQCTGKADTKADASAPEAAPVVKVEEIQELMAQ